MNYKYVEVLPENPTRYFEETVHKFNLFVLDCMYFRLTLTLLIYTVFSSSFQSLGATTSTPVPLKDSLPHLQWAFPLEALFLLHCFTI